MGGDNEQTVINTTAQPVNSQETPPKKPAGKRRANYAKIHADKLPLDITPLPAFVPHNPLSVLRIAYAVISEFFLPPTSHGTIYHGYFDAPTRSIHVTDEAFIRGLWEKGFFGKGSLSRSEPTWLHSEKTRLGIIDVETSDRVTKARRKEREEMKMPRNVNEIIKKKQLSFSDRRKQVLVMVRWMVRLWNRNPTMTTQFLTKAILPKIEMGLCSRKQQETLRFQNQSLRNRQPKAFFH